MCTSESGGVRDWVTAVLLIFCRSVRELIEEAEVAKCVSGNRSNFLEDLITKVVTSSVPSPQVRHE